ncbi:MAG: lysophospholipase [Deltaproteobacteria bacterium]|nr:lysophospholipase [Deltaproteobacteria bacterium]
MSRDTTAEGTVNLTRRPRGPMSYFPFASKVLTRLVVNQRTAPKRQPLPKTPSDYGMPYRPVEMSSVDGVRLSAWEIPAANSTGLAIVNHPLLCNRYGSVEGMDGVPVEFLPMVKHLHDAGISVLTYDQRGQGDSDGGLGKTAKGRQVPVAAGSTEWMDLVGVLDYLDHHPEFGDHALALVTHCMGANAALSAWRSAPRSFESGRVKCFVAVQPTLSYNMMSRLTRDKVGIDLADAVQEAQRGRFGFGFADALRSIGHVRVPMLFQQVRDDVYTFDEGTGLNDVQVIHDRCPTPKEMIWVGPNEPIPFGTGKRFEGYGYFNHHPEQLLAFLARHLGQQSP